MRAPPSTYAATKRTKCSQPALRSADDTVAEISGCPRADKPTVRTSKPARCVSTVTCLSGSFRQRELRARLGQPEAPEASGCDSAALLAHGCTGDSVGTALRPSRRQELRRSVLHNPPLSEPHATPTREWPAPHRRPRRRRIQRRRRHRGRPRGQSGRGVAASSFRFGKRPLARRTPNATPDHDSGRDEARSSSRNAQVPGRNIELDQRTHRDGQHSDPVIPVTAQSARSEQQRYS